MTARAGAYEVGRGMWSVVDAGAAAMGSDEGVVERAGSAERGKVMLCAHS
jgi:hypothetical protein